jgi:single-strand DNA-binding protein
MVVKPTLANPKLSKSEGVRLNKIIVIGNLGKDPEMRYTPSGQAVTSFSVASNRSYTMASGERREETEWFNVNAWGKLGELCNQYLTKGRQVYVEGRLRSRSYEARDGQQRFVNEINLSDVQFLAQGSGTKGEESPYASETTSETAIPPVDEIDDLPF